MNLKVVKLLNIYFSFKHKFLLVGIPLLLLVIACKENKPKTALPKNNNFTLGHEPSLDSNELINFLKMQILLIQKN